MDGKAKNDLCQKKNDTPMTLQNVIVFSNGCDFKKLFCPTYLGHTSALAHKNPNIRET